jgi:hypothetical protein
MVLFDVGEVYCNLNLQSPTGDFVRSTLSRHVRIKILNEKGFDRANIRIKYYSDRNLEDILNIAAQTINLDASGNPVYTKVDKSLIYRKKLNKRYSEVIFTFPDVKKGSILEYKYVDEAQNLYALKNWYFQRSIPVKMSRYTLNFPKELTVTATFRGSLPVDRKEQDEGWRNIKSFTQKDIPALKDEAYITCDEDYLEQVVPVMQALDIVGQPRQSLIKTWPKIIKELMEDEDFGIQLKRNIPRTSDLDALLAKTSDNYQKMVTIHDYVRKNMVWNEYYGIWALDGVRSAWKDKKGTSGEINLILVNLLKDAGLKVHPILVSTRENGRVIPGLADYTQFNKVLAYVELNDHVYVLDATDHNTPANLVPFDVLYSEGLVIEKPDTYEWGWKFLSDDKKLFKNTTLINAQIDEQGSIKGVASITSFDYSRLERIPAIKKGKQKFVDTYLNSDIPGLTVDSVSFENEDVDSLPLNQYVSFTNKTNASGDFQYFTANLFSGLNKNPFLAENRFSDVFFGANQNYLVMGNFKIPEGYEFDELPQNMKMIMPDTSIVFSRRMQANGNEIAIKIMLEIKKPFYTVEEYPDFQEFYKKLFELLNEQIVFRKK